ncbi:MAG: hypothetical protein K8S18_00120 [Desulfobacula sp.]|nr:hypothetical protein [Desulfobacula sp.]
MTDKSIETVGFLGIVSVLFGILSLFIGGLASLFVGFGAVMIGFFGIKQKQVFSQTGMIIGSVSLLFFNFVSMGIIQPSLSQTTGKEHLADSIYRSIDSFEILKSGELDEDKQEQLINAFSNALKQANLVNVEKIENQVPGFASHYSGEFIKGMSLLIQGYENDDMSKKIQGGMLLDKWGKWNNENNQRLDKIKEPSFSLFSFAKGVITK